MRHCVFVRLAEDSTPAQWSVVVDGLRDLAPRLEGVRGLHAGDNVSPEEGMDKGFSVGFIIDFVNAEARDAYLSHPGHTSISSGILALAAGGDEGVFVYDLETSDADE
jgi:stress responsive alpha/beta barrel protein